MRNTSTATKNAYLHIPSSPNESCDLSTPELTEQCMIAWISTFHCQYADRVWDLPRVGEDPNLKTSYADRVVDLLDVFFVTAGFRLGYVLEHSMTPAVQERLLASGAAEEPVIKAAQGADDKVLSGDSSTTASRHTFRTASFAAMCILLGVAVVCVL